MYLGRWPDVDSLLAAGDAHLPSSGDALWWRIISLRNQGRMHEALSLADEYRRLKPRADIVAQVPRGVVLLEMGRAAEARAVFDSTAQGYPPTWFDLPSWKARHRTWSLTRVATAAAAMGDTRALEWLVDSIEQRGRASALERDRRLHHYVRANLLASRGALGDAAQAYRRAIVSPTYGFSRINLELARVLIALGRPREAVTTVRAALRGGLEANNYYVTRTELHRELARAFDAAGNADSAIVHYKHVAAAWSHGDPGFRRQAESARHRAIALMAGARLTAAR
jgi:tetratricopeptide (TPR) repeat protein